MRAAAICSCALIAACGAKTQLQIPHFARDGSIDAPLPDANLDGGVDAGRPPDECIELPFNEPPRELDVAFFTQILNADVFFLVDVTGSMSDEINQIRTQLREEIIPGLAAEIPDVRFSVAHFADFPLPELNYGEADDDLFRLLQGSTTNLGAVQNAVDRLPLQGGRDGPEALIEALYLSATGEGMGRFVDAAICPAGTSGYPCFQPQGTRIVLAFTDAPSHNGPGSHDEYVGVFPPPHTYEQAVNELRMIGAKVLGLYSGGIGGLGESDLEALARDTGAVRLDGTPIVFDIGLDGSFLSTAVVEAVRTLVQEVPIDVDVLVEDGVGDAFDATLFVESIIADHAEPADGATLLGDRFADVRPGTRVFFRIMLRNDLVPQTDEPQSFLLNVVLRGDGVTRLSETLVQIVIPSLGGEGCETL